jgi:hypothetical protein
VFHEDGVVKGTLRTGRSMDAIYAYIAADSPEYALRMVDRLTG